MDGELSWRSWIDVDPDFPIPGETRRGFDIYLHTCQESSFTTNILMEPDGITV